MLIERHLARSHTSKAGENTPIREGVALIGDAAATSSRKIRTGASRETATLNDMDDTSGTASLWRDGFVLLSRTRPAFQAVFSAAPICL